HVLQLVYNVDCLSAEHLDGILVTEVVAPLHGVEHVPLPAVLLDVSQGCADPSLRSAGMGTCRIQLAQHRDATGTCGIKSRHQSSAARADDQCIVLVYHVEASITFLLVPGTSAV